MNQQQQQQHSNLEYIATPTLAEAMECIDHEVTRITACERIDNLWFLTVEDNND